MPQVEYEVIVAKTGDGATQASNELKALQTAAAGANNSLQQATPAMQQLNVNTKTATTAIKSLQNAVALAGLQTFPQLTSAAMLAKNAIDGLRASGANLQLGFTTVTAGVVGLAAAVISAAQAWAAYAAERDEAMSSQGLQDQTKRFAEDLRKQVNELREAGSITVMTRDDLMDRLGSASGNQQVRATLKALKMGSAQDRISDMERMNNFGEAGARLNLGERFDDKKLQQQNLIAHYKERIALYQQLRNEGMITEKQLQDMSLEALTHQYEGLSRVKAQLTEIQQLGRSVAENFAGGLSAALVDSFTQGGKALQRFFVQFMQQTAQMILQLLIMRALRAAFGFSEGGTAMAATGGMFPRFAANGLAGVHAVSQATYFPKFNVVAGEAGREMLTVLARPRFMEVGGVEAVVGNAGPNRLAITNADALQQRGMGGTIIVQVQGTPDFEARVVSNSVKGAQVQVANDMRTDSAISRGVKKLSA